MDIIRKDKYNIMYNHYNEYVTGDLSDGSADDDDDATKSDEIGMNVSDLASQASGSPKQRIAQEQKEL